MSISFDFSALEVQKRNIKPAMKAKVNNLIYKHSLEMMKRVYKRTPYCTGTMFDGWEYDADLDSRGWAVINITNDVKYAKFVNDGTVDSDGNFLVELSLYETLQNFRRDLAKPGANILKTKRKRPPRADAVGKVKAAQCKNP